METASFADAQFGTVTVRHSTRALHIIFRVEHGALTVTLPVRATLAEAKRALERNRVRLLPLIARSPQRVLKGTQVIETQAFRIELRPTHEPVLRTRLADGVLTVNCPVDAGGAVSAEVEKRLRAVVHRRLKPAAETLLPVRLHDIATRLGLRYRTCAITCGVRQLGRCNARGDIGLSCRLLFLPQSLIDYVICHELAHLTFMNHGVAFHQLCNRYTGGHEKELVASLRAFRFLL